MCFFPKQDKMKIADPPAPPEPIAEEQDVGSARKTEDQTLFGGTPNLRRDPSLQTGTPGASSSGLKM